MFGIGTPLTAKALGIVIAAFVLSNAAWGTYAYVLRADAKAANSDKTLAEGQRDTLQASLKNLTDASKIGNASLERVRGALAECQGRRRQVRETATMIAARLQADLADANATLAAVTERYQNAMRDPDCLICADRPVCPALVAP